MPLDSDIIGGYHMPRPEDDFRRRLFAEPMPDDLYWSEIKQFLESLGATVTMVAGAPVRVYLNGQVAIFQHIYADKPAVSTELRYLREFLERTRVGCEQDDDDP
jgi:hypothetical protein